MSISRTSIDKAFVEYWDVHGMVAPSKGGGSNNGLLYTAEWIILLNHFDCLTDVDRSYFRKLVNLCFVEPGLLKRAPLPETDQEGPDDYAGVIAASICGMPEIASEILKYGRSNQFNYNNVVPGTYRHRDGRFNWSAQFLRFPALIAHIEYAAGETPPLFRQVYWNLCLIYAALFDSSADAGALNWLYTVVKPNALASRFWKWRRLKPDNLARTLADPEHPLGKMFAQYVENIKK